MNERAFTHSEGRQLQQPRYVAELNLGQVIQIAMLSVTFGGMIWWQSNFQSRTEARLESAEKILASNVPVVSTVAQTQAATAAQLSALGESLKELRDTNRALSNSLTSEAMLVRERLAAIEAALRNDQKVRGNAN